MGAAEYEPHHWHLDRTSSPLPPSLINLCDRHCCPTEGARFRAGKEEGGLPGVEAAVIGWQQ